MVAVARDIDSGRLVALFADLLAYPRPGIGETALECRALVADGSPGAAKLLDDFLADLERIPLGQLEELYTGAFDLDTLSDINATCYPYVGHHLLGETYKRSTFMVELRERYEAHGFEVDGGELPDHVVVILRFIASAPDSELAEDLVVEALLPALSRMTKDGDEVAIAGEGGRRVYLRLLEALRLALPEQSLWAAAAVRAAELAAEPEEARAEEVAR